VEALKKKDTVRLTGFGTFKLAKRKARRGKNPLYNTFSFLFAGEGVSLLQPIFPGSVAETFERFINVTLGEKKI